MTIKSFGLENLSLMIEAYPYMLACDKKINVKDYVIRRRALNVALCCVQKIHGIPFDDLVSKSFFSCSDEFKYIISFYEGLLYDCSLDRDKFYKTIHERFFSFANKVKENHQLGLLVEFNDLVTKKSYIKWDDKCSELIFGAYLSLIQQSLSYFYDDLKEYPIYYDESSDSFVTIPDKYPMIDYCIEDMQLAFIGGMVSGKPITDKERKKLFEGVVRKFNGFGMYPKSMYDVECIFSSANNYGNMLMGLLYYMNKNTKDMIPQSYLIGAVDFEFPRKWFDTDYYIKRLKKRNFVLPPETIKATLKYAKDIKEIWLHEVVKDGKVIVLYKVIAERSSGVLTDFVGYYIPSDEFFFSYFDMSHENNEASQRVNVLSEPLKKFVLEIYFLLTVRRTDEEKTYKKYSLPLIAEEYEDVNKIPRWNNQPIVSFSFSSNDKNENGKKGQKKTYKQGYYEYDDINIGCFIRRLPNGYKVSALAKANAEKYGYELEDGYTFVVPFERKQRFIKMIGE